MYVIGTAGHVDHGKSTLIEALTGIDPDRLQEEKARGMTIELGFAWVTLPNGLEVSIVDVPGHERFIKNMLMGVGGIDLALLIVAADEGVMPQTREHLAILDLLRIRRAITVITKRDLVDDDWLDLVKADIQETQEGTTLEGSPMVSVSATTGAGMDDLVAAIQAALEDLPVSDDLGRPRLPVDRSFTMSGFGTVVTGTLIDGRLRPGQEVEILPGQLPARIRSLQTHRRPLDQAEPGTRVAVNLSGVGYDQISKGDVLTTPRWLRPTDAMDVTLRLIRDAPRPLKHNAAVTLYTGSSETPARVRLLGVDRLQPGETGWAQLRPQSPLAVVKGDYFVIRDSVTTLGGGAVVAPHARRHRRFHQPTLHSLAVLERGSEAEVLLSAIDAAGPAGIGALARAANMSEDAARSRVEELVSEHRVVAIASGGSAIYYSDSGWARLSAQARGLLQDYHRRHPLRSGISREELRSRLRLQTAIFGPALAALAAGKVLVEDGRFVRTPEHKVALSPEHEAAAARYIAVLGANPYSPPTDQKVDPDLLQALVDQGRVVRLTDDVVLLSSAFSEMVERVIEVARQNGQITIGDVRDIFGTSRKYTLALLEHLDRTQVTRRVGDNRVLR